MADGRRSNVIPWLGAISRSQVKENLATTDIQLDEEQLHVLDECQRILVALPHDLLRRENVANGTYGDHWRLVDDRGTTYRPKPRP